MRLTDYDKLQYDLVNALLECKDPSLGEPYEKGFKDGVRYALGSQGPEEVYADGGEKQWINT